MLVKELIELLQTLEPNFEILIDAYTPGFKVEDLSIGKYEKTDASNTPSYYTIEG